MADTNSASRFGSASIHVELKKELLSKTIPQNTKSCTKFAFMFLTVLVSRTAILHASHFIELAIQSTCLQLK